MLLETAYVDPYKIYRVSLLGGSVDYDVELSQANCGCVAGFYLTSSPGKNSSGEYWNTDGYYYCDGNQVGGNYCPEFDIMEANIWSFATTPHSCDSPTSAGYYKNCNRYGDCYTNIVDKLNYYDYGPGTNYKINTL